MSHLGHLNRYGTFLLKSDIWIDIGHKCLILDKMEGKTYKKIGGKLPISIKDMAQYELFQLYCRVLGLKASREFDDYLDFKIEKFRQRARIRRERQIEEMPEYRKRELEKWKQKKEGA